MSGAEAEPLIPRRGSRGSSLDAAEDELRDAPPPADAPELDVDSTLLSRARYIFAFGIVATVIILLGVVASPRDARAFGAPALGVPHEGMRPDLPSGAASSVAAALAEDDPAAARSAARKTLRAQRRRHRRWERDASDASDASPEDASSQDASSSSSSSSSSSKDRSSDRLAALLGAAPASDPNAGVSLNGWLQLEEWFFSSDRHSLVDSPEDAAQGVVFPPSYPSPASLGFEWSSEGDLVAKLRADRGDAATIDAFRRHRETYVTDADLDAIVAAGFRRVRLPVTWATFAGLDGAAERVVADPAYPDVAFVTVTRAFLNAVVERLAARGLSVLVDVHSMPGGSSAGSYNGVFPRPPIFWDDQKLMTIGRGALREMMRWYGALAPASRAAVGGFTLLNEPAHLMEEKRSAMLAWYASAVDDYRRLVVETSPAPPPTLFVNFIETSGMNVYEMAAWIAEHFTEAERAAWVALDVHMYLAWEFPAPGAWSCDASRDEAYRGVFDFISAKVGQLRQAADGAGVRDAAVSEWSLATHRDSREGCADADVVNAVHDAQTDAFKNANVKSYFWGWKMPYAGVHRAFWDMARRVGFEDRGSGASEAAGEAAREGTGAEGSGGENARESEVGASEEDPKVEPEPAAEITEPEPEATATEITEPAPEEAATEITEPEPEAAATLPSGYSTISVNPADQGDGHIAEMRAAMDRADAAAADAAAADAAAADAAAADAAAADAAAADAAATDAAAATTDAAEIERRRIEREAAAAAAEANSAEEADFYPDPGSEEAYEAEEEAELEGDPGASRDLTRRGFAPVDAPVRNAVTRNAVTRV